MRIKSLDFGNYVFGQSGVQGFFDEPDENPHHKLYRILFLGFHFLNMVFVAKTVTLRPRVYPKSSNTPLRDGYKLKKFFPKSVWFSLRSFFRGYMLKAMDVPNPGLEEILKYGKWQERRDCFQISIVLTGSGIADKVIEAEQICKLLYLYLPPTRFHRYALQINFSCSSIKRNGREGQMEIVSILSVFKRLLPEVALIPKFNILIEPETISAVKYCCDAFCITDTLEFGTKEDRRWWSKFFSEGKSPLIKRLGGNFAGEFSGAPLSPLLIEWLEKMEKVDDSIRVIAEDGIMKKKDILKLSEFKIVHGVAFETVATLRPWRVAPLIKYGNEVFQKKALSN